ATATSHSFRIASATGLNNVRIRVVAKDRRFQNSSAESSPFAIAVTTLGVPGDLNGDLRVNVSDLLLIIGAWGVCGASCPADLNHDGGVNVGDLLMVIAAGR